MRPQSNDKPPQPPEEVMGGIPPANLPPHIGWPPPQPEPAVDMVNHPPHYTAGRFEVIDVIEDWQLTFCLGNTVKYVARAGKKGDAVEDLKKARWYLDREIARLEAKALLTKGAADKLRKMLDGNPDG